MSTLAIKRLATVDADFTAKMDALLAFEGAQDDGIERTVIGILADVKVRGDAAVIEYTNKFDRLTVSGMADLELNKAELQAAWLACRLSNVRRWKRRLTGFAFTTSARRWKAGATPRPMARNSAR